MRQRITRAYLVLLLVSGLFINWHSGYCQNNSIDSLRIVLKNANERNTRFNILKQLSFEYRKSKPDSALYFGLTAIELGNQLGDESKLAEVYNFLGLAHLYKGELLRAFDNYQSAMSIAETFQNQLQIAHSNNNLGRLFLQMGDAEQSRQHFLVAKKAFENLDDSLGLSYLYRSFAEWHEYKKQYDSAIFFSTKALNLRRQLQDKNSLVSALIDIGQLHLRKKEYTRTSSYLREAEKLANENRDPFLLAEIKIEIIELLVARDSLQNVDEKIREADKLVSIDYLESRAKLNLLKSRVALKKKNNAQAIDFLKLVADDDKFNNYEMKGEAASLLVEVFYTQGNFKEAEKYRLKLKMEQGYKRNQGLINELEKINLKFELERRSKLNHERELTMAQRKSTFFVLGGIILFIGLAVGIAYFFSRKRARDKKTHEAQEELLLSKLTVSEKENKKLVEESLLVICTHNMEGRVLSINTPGARAIGYEPQELINKSIQDVIPKENTDGYITYMEEIRATGTSSGFIRIATRWNETRIFLYRNILVDDGGKPAYVMASALDVTEWKKTEQEEKRLRAKLAESENLYRLLSENSSDLVCLHNPNGTYQFVSSSITDLLGYTSEELIGTDPTTLVHPEDHFSLHQQSASSNVTSYRMKKKDGHYSWMETYVQTIETDGKLTGFQTSSRDITLRKEYEEALKEAKDKAEEATMYKTDFVSSMSHEIRTPLNAIIGLADILLKRSPREDQVKIFQMLKNSGDNLLSIVNDILDFSKIEAGKMELEETVFNLPETVKEVVQLFQSKGEIKNVKVIFEGDPLLPTWMKADPLKITQILSNLVSNAIKFTEQGSVKVMLKLVSRQNNQVAVLFSVKDTGIGIPADKLNVIFESFAQAGQDTARVYGGTGLGLAIVKKLAALMGSEISVNSEPTKGSEFSFILKALEVPKP
jgi:PAS domain S-box-containing protein